MIIIKLLIVGFFIFMSKKLCLMLYNRQISRNQVYYGQLREQITYLNREIDRLECSITIIQQEYEVISAKTMDLNIKEIELQKEQKINIQLHLIKENKRILSGFFDSVYGSLVNENLEINYTKYLQ